MGAFRAGPGAWWWATWRRKRRKGAALPWFGKATASPSTRIVRRWNCMSTTPSLPVGARPGQRLLRATPAGSRPNSPSMCPTPARVRCWTGSNLSWEINVATPEQRALQRDIIEQLQVGTSFDAAAEIEHRTEFLANYLQASGMRTLVLGISGGVDSLVGGCLSQRAVERCRARGYEATFVAMRLPYGEQRDESDAQMSLKVIQPDETLVVDVKPASDAMMDSCVGAGLGFRDDAQRDFVLGNITARQRRIAQFTVAGARQGLVVGTDHAAEALMGFFTKFGDGAADVTPLTGLNKRRVRALAQAMGAPDE